MFVLVCQRIYIALEVYCPAKLSQIKDVYCAKQNPSTSMGHI